MTEKAITARSIQRPRFIAATAPSAMPAGMAQIRQAMTSSAVGQSACASSLATAVLLIIE